MEFLRDDFLDDREVPTVSVLALLRFRFLITSVLSESGLTTPWSFRNRPHALHRGWPSGLRLQRGVVWVKQLVQVVGPAFGSPFFNPPGLPGREGTALLRPDSGGVLGEGWFVGGPLAEPFKLCRSIAAALGVDAVRGTFP